MASPSPGAPTVDPSLGQVQVDQAAPAIAVQAPTLNVGDQADSSAQTREAASSAQGISEAPGPAGVATSNNAGQATPAIAGQPTLAIAGTLQPILATLDEIRAKPNDQKWIVNNSAIKWIRNDYEKPPGVPICGMVDITEDPIKIGVVSREKGKGPAFTFVEGQAQEFSWRKMLRSFDESTQAELIGGGITDIVLMPFPKSFCHKRQKAAERGACAQFEHGNPPLWDFVVTRTDGSRMRFHPDLTKKGGVLTFGRRRVADRTAA